MSKFTNWMKSSTMLQKRKIAKSATTSVGQLYQLATGDREASATLAAKLEAAFKKLYPTRGITRGDLNKTCARCPYFKKCKGTK